MENIKIVILLVMCVSAAVCLEEPACCLKGLVLNVNNQYKCWEPELNETTAMAVTCPFKHKESLLVPRDGMDFAVNNAGQLVIKLKNRQVYYEPGKFCVGARRLPLLTSHVAGRERVAVVFYTKTDRLIEESVCGYGMMISAVFLLLTAIVYAVRKELRDLQGLSIINSCGSLGIGLAILAGMKLLPYTDMNLCAARGFFAYFFTMVSFFWTNALSIQILLNMRRSVNSGINQEKGYGWYVLYAWGTPALLTIIMAIVNYIPGNHLKPGIGLDHCWFFDNRQQWIYMYSVLSFLIAINIWIFIYVTTLLWHNWYSNEKFTYKFLTTLRLFIVMGIPWVTEMCSALAPPHWTLEVLDLINSLQGVLIFAVLVLLPRHRLAQKQDTGLQYNLNISIEQPYTKM